MGVGTLGWLPLFFHFIKQRAAGLINYPAARRRSIYTVFSDFILFSKFHSLNLLYQQRLSIGFIFYRWISAFSQNLYLYVVRFTESFTFNLSDKPYFHFINKQKYFSTRFKTVNTRFGIVLTNIMSCSTEHFSKLLLTLIFRIK